MAPVALHPDPLPDANALTARTFAAHGPLDALRALSGARPPTTGLPRGEGQVRTGFGSSMRLAMLASLALFLVLILWAAQTPISGAAIVEGKTVVRGQPRDLQHLDGGIVTAINVRNGDLVREGEVLMELDPTLLKVNLDIARSRLAEDLAKKARLTAEQRRAGVPDVAAVAAMAEAAHLGQADLTGPVAGQAQIMAARAEVLKGQRDQLTEKTAQFDNQAAGLDAVIASQQEQLGYLDRDIANMEKLAASGLLREGQLLDAKRNRAELLGQIASYRSDRAGIANSVRDAEIGVAQGERQFREQVATDLGEVTAGIGELVLQIVTTRKQLDRVEIRAPVTGIVHELKITTLGGVIPAGQTVGQIVPTGEGMEFEMQLPARSADSAHPGQVARLKLTALDPQRTPELKGTVSRISPTSIMDEQTRQSFYRVEITVPPEELARLGDEILLPGMPVEGFLETGQRSALDWLVQPLANHMRGAFRER